MREVHPIVPLPHSLELDLAKTAQTVRREDEEVYAVVVAVRIAWRGSGQFDIIGT
jgi:hypothetical protein